ncbi:flavodoxin family protein [Actinokineospora spheciospongiae]|uniref:flavodoxin family protein n=1 Tax=Actinokineospora spheciospongiae TaxID=909613 RepID=UPI000D719AA4|nr:flavodoxin family protein [Actinokineospora spheciospongiae]PWW58256.1 multimeric flavodoxin WrbA [Actinokineospora spheciospongiae]
MASQKIRILALSGSERRGGNTEQVLEHAAELAGRYGAQLDQVNLREHRIAPCSACGDCNTRSVICAQQDDVSAIVDRMAAADALIYATPVHGFGPAHLMQIFLERAGVGYLRFQRPLANKVAGAIVISRRYADLAVHQQLLLNMLLNRMVVVGSGFPAVLRSGSTGRALDDVEGVEALDRMLERLVGMARLLKDNPDAAELLLSSSDTNERGSRPTALLKTAVPPYRGPVVDPAPGRAR